MAFDEYAIGLIKPALYWMHGYTFNEMDVTNSMSEEMKQCVQGFLTGKLVHVDFNQVGDSNGMPTLVNSINLIN